MSLLNKRILVVTILIIFIVLGCQLAYYLLVRNNIAEEKTTTYSQEVDGEQEKDKIGEIKQEFQQDRISQEELEIKIKQALNPQTCGPVKVLHVNGFIIEKGTDTITVGSQDGSEATIKLAPETLFLIIEVNDKGDVIFQREATYNDFSQHDSVVINYFLYEDDGQELIARIVKLIILNNGNQFYE